jgi:hypothetical protein
MDDGRRGWLSVGVVPVGVVSVAGGLLLGSLDLAWQRMMPYPLADLGNSMAVWALGAFLLGAWVRTGLLRAAVGASVLNLVAVEAYSLTAMVVQHDSAASLWAPSTMVWLAASVVAGAVFGVGGVWSRGERPWRRLAGRALPAAVFLAEAGVCFAQGYGADPAYRRDRFQDTLLYAVIALLLALAHGRTSRERATVLTTGIALAIPGFLALSLFTTQSI